MRERGMGEAWERHGRGMGEGKAWEGPWQRHGIANLLPAHGLSLLAEIAASHHQAILPDETVVGARAPAHGTPSSPPAFPSSPPCRSPPGLPPRSTHSTLSLDSRSARGESPLTESRTMTRTVWRWFLSLHC
jgi:hypothetical protein